jgi:hypothetical protein
MDCPEVQEWLLRSDLPEVGTGPADVAGHLEHCAACREFGARLTRLEEAVQAIPAPEGADAARRAFLKRLAPATAARQAARLRFAHHLARWGPALAAALLLMAAGTGIWLFTTGGAQTAEAATVLDQLVDWNLELADADALADSDQLYAARAASFARQAREGKLSPEDQELAGALLENGSRLRKSDGPLAKAENLTDMADVLVRHMNAAAVRGDMKKLQRLVRCYDRLMEHGVDANLDKAEAAPAPTPEHAHRLSRVRGHRTTLRDQLDTLMDQLPDASVKELKRTPRSGNRQHHDK